MRIAMFIISFLLIAIILLPGGGASRGWEEALSISGGIQTGEGFIMKEDELIENEAFYKETDEEDEKVVVRTDEEDEAKVNDATDKEDEANELFYLEVAINGEGSVEPAVGKHKYKDTNTVTIDANPSEGWLFKKWVIDGEEYSSPLKEVLVNSDIKAIAFFDEIENEKDEKCEKKIKESKDVDENNNDLTEELENKEESGGNTVENSNEEND